MGYLGPALLAITKGRQAVLDGRTRTNEMEQEAKQKQLQFVMQQVAQQQAAAEREAARKRQEAVLAETIRHNQAVESRPSTTTSSRIDPLSEEGIAATLKREKALKSIPTYGQTHPKASTGGGSANEPAEKPPTESERRSAGLLEQMRRSSEVVKNYNPKVNQFLSKVPIVGNYALQHDPETQKALQAGAQLYRSYLYTVSGATVNPDEALETAKTFLAQPGDSEELKEQKRQSVDDMIRTVETMAGRALKTPSASPDLVPNDKPVKSQVPKGMSPSGVARGDYLSDADYWEMLKGEGMTDAQATAKVLARKKKK